MFNVQSKTRKAKKVTQRYRKKTWCIHIASDATVVGQGCHMGIIPLLVCVISIICYNMHLLRLNVYMIFLQKSLDCNCVKTEAWKNAFIWLCWFWVEHIHRIHIHPKNVNKIVILYTFIFLYIVLDIMLNLSDINNFLFIFSIK